jgi:hypothetical protein
MSRKRSASILPIDALVSEFGFCGRRGLIVAAYKHAYNKSPNELYVENRIGQAGYCNTMQLLARQLPEVVAFAHFRRQNASQSHQTKTSPQVFQCG